MTQLVLKKATTALLNQHASRLQQMGPHWGTDHFVGIIRLPWDPYPVVLHVFKGSLFFSFPRLSAAQILPLCVQTAPDPDLRLVLPFAFLMSGGCEAGQSTCTWHLLSSSSLDGKCVPESVCPTILSLFLYSFNQLCPRQTAATDFRWWRWYTPKRWYSKFVQMETRS